MGIYLNPGNENFKMALNSLFYRLSIASHTSYRQYLNQYNMIFLNIQTFLGRAGNISGMIDLNYR